MTDYKQGQQAYYHEEGESFKVLVLENNSDKEREIYKLRLLESDSSVFPVGYEFECDKLRNLNGNPTTRLWELSILE